MSESDEQALLETFSMIVREAESLQGRLNEQLVAFSPERYPKNGTRLECLVQSLEGVAAMAELAARHVNDESAYV